MESGNGEAEIGSLQWLPHLFTKLDHHLLHSLLPPHRSQWQQQRVGEVPESRSIYSIHDPQTHTLQRKEGEAWRVNKRPPEKERVTWNTASAAASWDLSPATKCFHCSSTIKSAPWLVRWILEKGWSIDTTCASLTADSFLFRCCER